LLQESLASMDDRLHTARTLAGDLGCEYIYAPARRKQRLVDDCVLDSLSGLAILSRYPIGESVTIPLPADPVDGERIGLLATVAIDGAQLLLANLHLTYLGSAEPMRRTEFETLLQHPSFRLAHDAIVVGGDLNTRLPALPELIAGHSGFDVRDSWDVGGGQGSRATVPISLAADESRAHCIDYILSVSVAGGTHPGFASSAVVLGEPSPEGHYPSDHRGVTTTLLLNGPSKQ
jgi:endonuclease/exonuclease/phosphatase family metal-dependent hydrolase